MTSTVMDHAAPPGVGPGTADRPMSQFLRFAVGADAYAVRIEMVREILEVNQMTPLPLMPAFVRGVMNLRGAVVPVVDMAARLGLASTEIGRRTCVIMVDISVPDMGGRQGLGVLVDAVHEVFDVDDGGLEVVPRMGTKIDPAFILGMVRVRGQVTPALDLDRALSQESLTELIASYSSKGAPHVVTAPV